MRKITREYLMTKISVSRKSDWLVLMRGTYIKFAEKMKIKTGKYSSENGISAAARHFSMELGRNVNPSTVCGFKRAYLQELNRK